MGERQSEMCSLDRKGGVGEREHANQVTFRLVHVYLLREVGEKTPLSPSFLIQWRDLCE